MAIERRFLGWHRPALHLAVDFLFDEFAERDCWDMEGVVVALPGARAGRRLRELLAFKAAEEPGRCLLVPPRIVTAGELPEALYAPAKPVATELESLMAWAVAFQQLDSRSRQALFPRAPAGSVGLLGIAAEVASIDREFAAECVRSEDLACHSRDTGYAAGETRWQAFARLRALYDQALDTAGRVDLRRARDHALESGRLHASRAVVLIANADLPAIACRLLGASSSRVIALVHAPEEESAGFDPFGCLVTDYWAEAKIPLEDGWIEITDTPRDQAKKVAELVGRLLDLPSDLITVSVADQNLGAPVERALALSGRPARQATGAPLSASPPAQLLAALAGYLSEYRSEEFAALIRHPDIGDWLARELALESPAGPWLDLCDRYFAEHLPVVIAPGSSLPPDLDRAARATCDLAPFDRAEPRPLSLWAERIAAILARVYPPEAQSSAERPALAPLLGAVAGLARLGDAAAPSRLTFSEAVGFLFAFAGSQTLPAPASPGEIDIVGWLEAHLDDSPVLVLAGFNEGAVPESVAADPFLPESLRSVAGLLNNRQRYARDAYLLRAILASRPLVRVICGRLGFESEPLAPSRLFFACTPDQMVRRILAFYGERGKEDYSIATSTDLPAIAAIPRPRRVPKPLQELRVTDFKDYLRCPYRFYLKHVLGLQAVQDDFVEMGPDSFGDILHKVLRDYGRWVVNDLHGRPPTDAEAIAHILDQSLARRAQERFNEPMHPAVAIQVELLSRRLWAFAALQAAQAHEGWTILAVERKVEAIFDIDDHGHLAPFRVTGRIDRIDYHPGRDVYRILDYKSRDSGCDPESSHRENGTWTDLQLPLYRRIAPVIDIPERSVEVGYIALPKDLQKAGWCQAEWDDDEFHDAYLMADEVMRKVRDQEFWPPSAATPVFDDGFGAICQDGALDREAVIVGSDREAVWAIEPEGADAD